MKSKIATATQSSGQCSLRWIYPLLVLLALGGCAPAISGDLQREAGPPVSFTQLQAHPQEYQGKKVILGGEIMQVTPSGSGSELLVDDENLDPSLRPEDAAPHGGTFIVESQQYLSPDDYEQKRKITVAGEVEAPQGKTPVILAQQIRLWEHPFKLEIMPHAYYSNDKTLEHWYTAPYFDPYSTSPAGP